MVVTRSLTYQDNGIFPLDSIRALNKRAQLPDGTRLDVNVIWEHNGFPKEADVEDPEVQDALKNVNELASNRFFKDND